MFPASTDARIACPNTTRLISRSCSDRDLIANLNSVIDSLSLDHRRGAAEIVEDIIELFIAIARVGVKDPDSAEQLFVRGVKRLAHGQPSMAPVLNLLNRACLAREKSLDDWGELTISLSEIRTFRKAQLDAMMFRIDALPKAKETLITFSNSSTVAQIIIACRRYKWPKKVICGEGRPLMEGLVMAKKLTSANVPVTVYTDAALMSQIVDADAVWVGGDSLSCDGLVNKVGSRALSMLARMKGIPFTSLMGSDKVLPADLCPYFRCLPQNPREVADDYAEELDVVNEYYETIPLELVDYIFTEKGLSKPEDLLENIQLEPVSSTFRQLVRDNV